jgi:hypothetical protein
MVTETCGPVPRCNPMEAPVTKPQTRWAVVFGNGHINHGAMAFTRRDAVAKVVAEHRKYSAPKYNGEGLTDTQFWRQIKQRRGFTVRKISMKVM